MAASFLHTTVLLEEGVRQVEQSHDEGETAGQISGCLDLVFQAVPRSSRSDAKKLLYAIDMDLRDQYDLCEGAGVILDHEWPLQKQAFKPWLAADNFDAQAKQRKSLGEMRKLYS